MDEQLGRARSREQAIGLGEQAGLGVEAAGAGGGQQRVVGAGARQQSDSRVASAYGSSGVGAGRRPPVAGSGR